MSDQTAPPKLIPVWGDYIFDPATGYVYREDGTRLPFTWQLPPGCDNPFQFATKETADKMYAWAMTMFVQTEPLKIVENDTGQSIKQLALSYKSGDIHETYNCGMLAKNICDWGFTRARAMFIDGLKTAGFTVFDS